MVIEWFIKAILAWAEPAPQRYVPQSGENGVANEFT